MKTSKDQKKRKIAFVRRDVNPDDIPDHELSSIFNRLAWKEDFKFTNRNVRQFGRRYLSLHWFDLATAAAPESPNNVEDLYASPTESDDDE